MPTLSLAACRSTVAPSGSAFLLSRAGFSSHIQQLDWSKLIQALGYILRDIHTSSAIFHSPSTDEVVQTVTIMVWSSLRVLGHFLCSRYGTPLGVCLLSSLFCLAKNVDSPLYLFPQDRKTNSLYFS